MRFVIDRPIPDMSARQGLFCAAYDLSDNPELLSSTRHQLNDLLTWFREHLPEPEKFNRTTSKGAYRRNTKGLSWFRPEATEVLAKVRDMVALLEAHDCRIETIFSDRIGYVVYEDDWQVVAEPFADTPI